MHEVRTKFLYQVQGQADFQHCEVLKVVKLTVMTVCDDRASKFLEQLGRQVYVSQVLHYVYCMVPFVWWD
jgi:hypothetical protein